MIVHAADFRKTFPGEIWPQKQHGGKVSQEEASRAPGQRSPAFHRMPTRPRACPSIELFHPTRPPWLVSAHVSSPHSDRGTTLAGLQLRAPQLLSLPRNPDGTPCPHLPTHTAHHPRSCTEHKIRVRSISPQTLRRWPRRENSWSTPNRPLRPPAPLPSGFRRRDCSPGAIGRGHARIWPPAAPSPPPAAILRPRRPPLPLLAAARFRAPTPHPARSLGPLAPSRAQGDADDTGGRCAAGGGGAGASSGRAQVAELDACRRHPLGGTRLAAVVGGRRRGTGAPPRPARPGLRPGRARGSYRGAGAGRRGCSGVRNGRDGACDDGDGRRRWRGAGGVARPFEALAATAQAEEVARGRRV